MLSLSIVYIAINILLVIYIVFTNPFEARKKTTALFPIVFIFYILYFFDSYINRCGIQNWALNTIMKIRLFTFSSSDKIKNAHFFLGILIIIEILALYFMLYAFYENVFAYTPPILLSKKEKQIRIWSSILWKMFFFITLNLFLIFILKELNYAMELPLGFFAPIFKLGVSL